MKTGPLNPFVAFCAARRRSSRLPAFSRFSRFTGMEARRLVSCFGSQKLSVSFTSVKGTAWSFRSGASAARATGASNATHATHGTYRAARILFSGGEPQHGERVAGEGAREFCAAQVHRLGFWRNFRRLVNGVFVLRTFGGEHDG